MRLGPCVRSMAAAMATAVVAVAMLSCSPAASGPAGSFATTPDGSGSGAPASATRTGPPPPTAVPVESPTGPTEIVIPDYEPPPPACPGPLVAVEAPAVMVRADDGAVMPASMGSSSVVTCSTGSSVDVGEVRYPAPLIVAPDGRLTFRVDDGWRILWFEEVDFPKVGDGMNMTPGARLTDPPVEVTIPVPSRGGDMVVRLSMWVIRADGRAVAQIGPEIWVSAH